MKYSFLIVLFLFVSACKNEKSGHDMEDMNHENQPVKKQYTCPMHPEIIRDSPGQCPICNMDLVERGQHDQPVQIDNYEFLLKPTNSNVISQINTISPEWKELPLEIQATGKITYDTREQTVISSRVSGRIEKLYVKYRFQPVVKGQKLMELYSKELVNEQENFLYLMQNDPDNTSLIKTAENRLLLLGFTAEQLNQLKKTKKSIQNITIYSPATGHLHITTAAGPIAKMNEMQTSDSEEHFIREGMYVEKGQGLFTLYNTIRIWAVLNIFSDNIDKIKTGQKVRLIVGNNPFTGQNLKINFIEPEITPGQSTISARVYITNPDNKIKIGSNVSATIESGRIRGYFIPSGSLIHLGDKSVVLIREKNLFRTHIVEPGYKLGDLIEIISGLSEKDKIAENAQLLIDSESFIKIQNKQ